jgi:hypothetical protein
MEVPVGKVCTKQRAWIDRRQGRLALASGEPGAMRRVQTSSHGCLHRRLAV